MMLEAEKHVLCEKPLGVNVHETKVLFEFAKSKNLFLMEVRVLFYTFTFNPSP